MNMGMGLLLAQKRTITLVVLLGYLNLIGSALTSSSNLEPSNEAHAFPQRTTATRVAPTHGIWPTDAPHLVIRPFLAPETRYSTGHRGVDLAATVGASIYAPANGVVHFSGIVVDRPVISLKHDGGLLSSFEPVISTLKEGDLVEAGQPIGILTTSTHCAESCLHFGVRKNGEYISPLTMLAAIPAAILLPLSL